MDSTGGAHSGPAQADFVTFREQTPSTHSHGFLPGGRAHSERPQ